MRYFAYGSNMSLARLRQRVPSAITIGTYRLQGYELHFHKAGRDGSAKCDAFFTGSIDSFVYGRIFNILESEKAELDRAEGVGNGYDVRDVVVIGDGEVSESAFCYLATDIDATLIPFTWYRQHVLVGAREAGLPSSYLKAIATTAATRDRDSDRARRELSLYPGYIH